MKQEERTSAEKPRRLTRRGWMASVLMGVGLLAAYGALAVEGFLFLLPKRLKPKTRKLFAGSTGRFTVGTAQSFHDLKGEEILVLRTEEEFRAFSSICPHLGCRVSWKQSYNQFHCPCHGGVFRTDGVAIARPPAWAGQSLTRFPLEVDETTGVVYIEVADVTKKRA
ncbi:MAG: ubiquinol-cytochrome c reductase iron-sulfur subunit [Candidatus Tectimicrobiota bacterium]